MWFNSWEFVALVVATLGVYYLPLLRRGQVLMLVSASFVFYASHSLPLLGLLVGSIAINATVSRAAHGAGSLRAARLWAVGGVLANLGVLGFFKYAGLLGGLFFDDLGRHELGRVVLQIPLPVGISFYTFQGITLVVDLYCARDMARYRAAVSERLRTHWLHSALYLSFFAQLVAGPIVKAHVFLPQIQPKRARDVKWTACLEMLILGYFLKMVVSDNLKDHTFHLLHPMFMGLGSADMLVLLAGYSMEIFADLAGYALIAIGVGGLFGYEIPINFNFPYISRSFREFYMRWHMTLSAFFRDYAYRWLRKHLLPVVLPGPRLFGVRIAISLAVLMFLAGLWHGAAWRFAVWGLVLGAAVAVEAGLRGRVRLGDSLPAKAFQCGLVFVVWSAALPLTILVEIDHVRQLYAHLGSAWGQRLSMDRLYYVGVFSAPVVMYHAAYLLGRLGRVELLARLRPLAYGGMLFLILTCSGSARRFSYFQF